LKCAAQASKLTGISEAALKPADGRFHPGPSLPMTP